MIPAEKTKREELASVEVLGLPESDPNRDNPNAQDFVGLQLATGQFYMDDIAESQPLIGPACLFGIWEQGTIWLITKGLSILNGFLQTT